MRIHTALIVVVAMLAASSTSGVSAAVTAGAEAVDITVPATTVAEPEATRTRDIVYLEMDGHEYLIDVYVPAGAGPWPVVVALHGAMVYKDHPQTTVVAQAASRSRSSHPPMSRRS